MNISMRFILLTFLLAAPSVAMCEVIDDKAKLSDFNSINVRIHDNVSNGCWTNISETKSYAYGQLELRGATVNRNKIDVGFESEGNATLGITVLGSRVFDACFGHITIKLEQFSLSQSNLWSVRFYSNIGSTLAHNNNLNNRILDEVKRAVEDWD
jgi:hypothetical protein